MQKMNYSFEIDCDDKSLFKILTNYENLPTYLPRKIQKIEISEEENGHKIINVTIFLRTLIKKEFSQKLRVKTESENELSIQVLDGIAKGTIVKISILKQSEKTLCHVNSEVKMSLKMLILLPIVKSQYNSFVSNVFKKMGNDAKQVGA
tara:strand:+ start:134 stop:580 length:447 start_codon:yes stop_codon:yes gene_type:complete